MCYAIKIVHFGCLGGDQHVEYAVVRCKGGLEYIMLMPIKETCKGTKSVEDWRMEPCRFCKEYMETRRRSGLERARLQFAYKGVLADLIRLWLASLLKSAPTEACTIMQATDGLRGARRAICLSSTSSLKSTFSFSSVST